MQLSEVVERLELVVDTARSPDAGQVELRAALGASVEVESYVAARRAELVRALDAHPTAFPEAAIAEASGCSLGAATKETERASTLDAAGAMAGALSDGAITTGHVDALTRAARNLDSSATAELFGDDEALAAAAAGRSIAEFNDYVKRKAKQLDTFDGEARLEQQRRSTRLRTWTDSDGMWNLKGRFDPDLGKNLARRIGVATRRKFSEETPPTAPDDPFERTQHLEALALADLILGDTSSGAESSDGVRPSNDGDGSTGSSSSADSGSSVGRKAPGASGGSGGSDRRGGSGRLAGSGSGPPLVVIDASQTDGAGAPVIDWGIPVELPMSVLTDVLGCRQPDAVIVANGLVLHAPGRLDLGRATRLANRAQRRALQGLYATCAVPGCAVHFDRCRLHHVTWWRHGGRTDLANLLPVCQHHHSRLHSDGWEVTLGPQRELAIGLPDGNVMRTDPPRRSTAARGN